MSSNSIPAQMPATVLGVSQWTQISQAVSSLNRDQLNWLSGYLAGVAQLQAPDNLAQAQPQTEAAGSVLTILYGSQTGNAKGVAEEYKAKAIAAGIKAELVNMADYKAKKLKSETHVVIVVSTHGEGDAPDDAVELHEFLDSKKAPKLPDLKYAVVGLGDSSYEFFCQTAKDFDLRLEKLGAKRITPRVDCDVDYEEATGEFIQRFTEEVKDELTSKGTSQVVPMPGVGRANLSVATSQYSKKNPFTATLLESQKITGRDSVKDIRHIEISLEDSGIEYSPGDALGIWFTNDASVVNELLELTGADGDSEVTVGGDSLPLREALSDKLELTQAYPTFVKACLGVQDNAALQTLSEDKAALRDYLGSRQIVDVVREHPVTLSAQQLADALRPITPRLYSIASSQAEVEEEVHLTVALVEYEVGSNVRQGGASSFLANRLSPGAEVKVFVESNNNFRLPENPDTPVIMVGPGTGVAPFRAFMQQRAEEGAEGKNWLFFGNPNYTQDFLYQTEWQRFVKDGVVDKITLAFSRDQQDKIYVQHRLLEHGADVYQWLEQGAHFYVCGDATHMAKDVHEALVSIVSKYGNKNLQEAEDYVTELRRSKRYQKDVY